MKFTRLLLIVCLLSVNGVYAADLSDVLGVCHVDGKYFLTDKDFLNEGADQVLATGSRVLKVYLTPGKYPWNSQWPKDVHSLREVVQLPYYQSVFSKPFTTYVLTAYSVGLGDNYWTTSVSDDQKAGETKQFHDLAEYLLATYKGTGKTFVLQQWEGDWAMRGGHQPPYDANYSPDQTAIDGMIQWINARQAGIVAARNENKDTDVHVYGALEANLVEASMAGKPGVINSVLPHTTVDLASYSSYISLESADRLEKAVDYIAAHLPTTAAFGQNPHSVYLGELGYPENGTEGADGVNKRLNSVFAVVKSRGIRYALYWDIYCNEPRHTDQVPAAVPPFNGNDGACMGFWMIQPDGRPSTAWHRYRQALAVADPARATTSAIKSSLIDLFSEKFDRPDSTDIGPNWTKNSHYGDVNQSLKDHHLRMDIPDGSKIPWGCMTLHLDRPDVLGRGLNPGEYAEFTVCRNSDHAMGGIELFGSDQLRQGMGMTASTPIHVWNGKTWVPISIDEQGNAVNYDWSTPHTIGVRFDSADGYFAVFSYYIDGNYSGSWLVKASNKTMNTIGLYVQSDAGNSAVEFSDLHLWGHQQAK